MCIRYILIDSFTIYQLELVPQKVCKQTSCISNIFCVCGAGIKSKPHRRQKELNCTHILICKRFSFTNGVIQGLVNSPILFSVYIDDLFKILRASGFGCRVVSSFFGWFGYADEPEDQGFRARKTCAVALLSLEA